MMRKGPIERYSVDATLRTAASEGCNGSIELRSTSVVGRIYLEKGYVYFAELEGAPPPAEVAHTDRPSKDAVRRYVESVLCVLYEVHAGWYELDPLGAHDGGVRWLFGIDGLERAVRVRLEEDRSLKRWSRRPVTFEDAPGDIIRISTDMWQMVMAMTSPASTHQLRDQLGWDADRLASTLEGLERMGLIPNPAPAPVPPRPTFPQTTEAVPSAMPEPAPEAERTPEPATAWVGTPDLTPRQLVHATNRVAERSPTAEPAAQPAAGPRLTAQATTPRAPSPPSIARPKPPAPEARPPANDGGGSNRKSALKRLISSLRQ